MKIIHLSDTHLGFSEYGKIDPTTGINQREADFYSAWNQAIEAILRLQPDVVIHAGDLFHTPRPSNRAIHTALVGIQRVADSAIPWVIISGNHETPRIRVTGSIFESIALFENVYTAHSSSYQRFRIQEVDFHCVPHCSLTEEMESAFNSVRFNSGSAANIFITHGAWTGGNYYGMGEFNEQRLPDIEGILHKEFNYIALGHYHRQVDVKANASYSGSTERTSLNEHANPCGFLLLDLQTGEKQYHPIQIRPMKRLPAIHCDGMTVSEIYHSLESLEKADLAQAIVEIILQDIESDAFLKLDTRLIDELFAHTFYLEKQLIRKVTDGIAPAASAHIASLPVEFERYLNSVTGLELDSAKLGRMGMQYLSEED
jgi:exonuclease SbcD